MFQEKSQFQARSGRTIKVGEDGTLIFDHVHGYLNPDSAMDAEEFFQAKHDEDLGRWRYPSDPEWVVRDGGVSHVGRVAIVLNERTFEQTTFTRSSATGESAKHGAARAYFEAHPERKPWHDAKVGQVWAIRMDPEAPEFAVHVVAGMRGPRFQTAGEASMITLDYSGIVSARLVFDEDES